MSNDRPTFVPTHPRIAELDRLGDEIAELSAHLDAATARLLALIREFDTRGGWNTGFRSCAEWLAWRVGLDLGAARERVRVAHALETLPRLAEALARGEVSYSKVRALTRVATPETEARLLAVGRAGTAWHVERIVRGWRKVDRLAEAREAKRQHASRSLSLVTDDDGTVVVRGRLTPEAGALLRRALDAARERLYQQARRAADAPAAPRPLNPWSDSAQAPPTPVQQQADALALLAETALHHALDPRAPGERYQVVVHVDAAVLTDPAHEGQTALEEGIRISAETSRRLACDANRVVMAHGPGGEVVEVGARTRTIPPALRRALLHRDQHCRFPGCGVRVGEGHQRAALGRRGADDALESGAALSPTSPHGARGGLHDRARARRRLPVPAAGRPPAPRRAAAGPGARRSRRDAQGHARRPRPDATRPHRVPPVAGRAPRPGLGARRVAPPGQPPRLC